MAIVALPQPFLWPSPPPGGNSQVLTGPQIFGASGAYQAVFQVPKTGNMRTFHWATGNVTTGATIDLRLETVSLTTGSASGTLFGPNTNASVVVGSGDDSVFFSTTLTADAAGTQGDYAALVVQNPAVSFGTIALAAVNLGGQKNLPYGGQFDPGAGTWAKSNNLLMFAVEYDDGTIVPIDGILPPATASTSVNVSTSSTPDVYGQLFAAPAAMRVAGAWVMLDQDGDCNVRLVSTAYNQGAGTGILAGIALDANVRRDGNGALAVMRFPASFDLVAGTSYRLIFEPTTTTNSAFSYYNTNSLLSLDAWGFGCLTTAKDPTGDGDWTNYNSGTFRWALMGLLIGGVDSTAGFSSGGAFTFVG